MYFSKFLTTSAKQRFSRVTFDGCFRQYIGVKKLCSFLTNFDPLRETCLRACLFLF